jgi:hypothetical protein
MSWLYQPLSWVEAVRNYWDIGTKTIINITRGVFISEYITRDISLVECLVLIDSIINGLVFIKEYSLYKITEGKMQEYGGSRSRVEMSGMKEEIVKKCNSVYKTNVMDRYLLYLGIHMVYSIVYYGIDIMNWNGLEIPKYSSVMYMICVIPTLPIIQNAIVEMRRPKEMIEAFNGHKKTFVRYTISKFVINGLILLDEEINEIKNYHIFILYHDLSIKYVYNFAKSYIFIFLMYTLRQTQQTYYYYKAIKLAYYYNSGYLFNVITRREAAYIINDMVKRKRWKDMVEVEVTHALHVIIANKLQTSSDTTTIQLGILRFFTIWTLIAILKLTSVEVKTSVFIVYTVSRMNRGVIGIASIVYLLIVFNTNDIVIGLILLGYKPMQYLIEEGRFYIRNRRDIKKVLNRTR